MVPCYLRLVAFAPSLREGSSRCQRTLAAVASKERLEKVPAEIFTTGRLRRPPSNERMRSDLEDESIDDTTAAADRAPAVEGQAVRRRKSGECVGQHHPRSDVVSRDVFDTARDV